VKFSGLVRGAGPPCLSHVSPYLVVITVRVELYLVEFIPLLPDAQHSQNVRIFLGTGSCIELPRHTTTWCWLHLRDDLTELFVFVCTTSTSSLVDVLVIGLDASIELQTPTSAPPEVFSSL
jgi:hypothetical protein